MNHGILTAQIGCRVVLKFRIRYFIKCFIVISCFCIERYCFAEIQYSLGRSMDKSDNIFAEL